MDRFDFYFRQPVSESEMDAAFDGVEQALWDLVVDTDLIGVLANAVVTEHTPNNLTVDVSGSAAIHDKAGQRIAFGPVQVVDLSVDNLSVTTAVGTPGNEKIVSLFAKFDRTLSDPRIDGNSLTVYWNRAETFDFFVTQGAESAPPATPPALHAEYILLADVRRSFGVSIIVNADITGPTGTYTGHSDRREDAFVITAGASVLRSGTPEESDQALATALSSGGGIAFTGTANWFDASGLAATDVSAAINEVVSDLASATDGGKRVGSPALATWHDGVAVGASSVWGQLNQIPTDLKETTGFNDCGADRIGAAAYTGVGPTNPLALSANSIMEQMKQIVDKLNPFDAINDWSAANTFGAATTFTAGVTFNSTITSTQTDQTWVLVNNGSFRWFTSISGLIAKLNEDLTGFELHNSDLKLGRLSNIEWKNLTGEINSERTISIAQIAGTGSVDGFGIGIKPQQAQDSAGVANRGGPVRLYAGEPGAGTSPENNYGTIDEIHEGSVTTKTYYHREEVTGLGSFTWDDPDGVLAANEGAYFRVRLQSMANTGIAGNASYSQEYYGQVYRDNASAMYANDFGTSGAGQGIYSFTINADYTASPGAPRLSISGDDVSTNKWCHVTIEITRYPFLT
jgi:hypothetical protein